MWLGSSRLVFKEALLSTLRAYGTTRGAVTKALEFGIVRALVLLKPDRIESISLACDVDDHWESAAVATIFSSKTAAARTREKSEEGWGWEL